MSLETIYCSVCNFYGPCYHVCCLIIYLCRDCLLDDDILDNNYLCPECGRQLDAVYRTLVSKARFNENVNRTSQKSFMNNNSRNSQANQNYSFMRNQSKIQSSKYEQSQFQFAETFQQKKSQVKKARNNFTAYVKKSLAEQSHKNFNHQEKYYYAQGNKNYTVGPNAIFMQQMNQGQSQNQIFGIDNSKNFNQRSSWNNNHFENQGNSYFDQETPFEHSFDSNNLGYQQQNNIYSNSNVFNQRNTNYRNGNGGFAKSIRQSRSFNQCHNFQQSPLHNNQSRPQQQQQQPNFNLHMSKSHQFVIPNHQLKTNNNFYNNPHLKLNHNFQNPISFNQRDKNSFQFQCSPFQFEDNYFQSQQNERPSKSAGKVHTKKISFNMQNGKSSSFKIDNQGNHSTSDKQHSPSFGHELSQQSISGSALLPYLSNGKKKGNEVMQLENIDSIKMNRNESHDSLMTLGYHQTKNSNRELQI